MWLHGRNQELDINKYKKKTLEKSQKLQWVLMILFLDTSPAFINMHETIWLHHQFEHKSKANDFKSRESSSCLKKVKKNQLYMCKVWYETDIKTIKNPKSQITPDPHSTHSTMSSARIIVDLYNITAQTRSSSELISDTIPPCNFYTPHHCLIVLIHVFHHLFHSCVPHTTLPLLQPSHMLSLDPKRLQLLLTFFIILDQQTHRKDHIARPKSKSIITLHVESG